MKKGGSKQRRLSRKRVLSAAMALCLMLALMPTMGFAESANVTNQTETTETTNTVVAEEPTLEVTNEPVAEEVEGTEVTEEVATEAVEEVTETPAAPVVETQTESELILPTAVDEIVTQNSAIVPMVDSPTTQIFYSGNPVTPTTGNPSSFAMGDTGVTCTVTVNDVPYAGSSNNIPAAIGSTVKLTFAGIPTGNTVTAEVATASGSSQKTIKSSDTDKTFSFAMSANSGQISVTVNNSATFVLSSQYTETYKSTYATIQYSIDGGTWTDLASGTTEKNLGGTYGYTLPTGTAKIKVIQPYDTTTNKYTTNNGVGWMGEFTKADGTLVQPYPTEFNGTTGYTIDSSYGPGTYYINFLGPFWSLFWDSKTGGQVMDQDVLVNGSCLIQDIDTNPAISHFQDPISGQKASWQDADGSRGFVSVINNTADITCTLTPARGYQVLSTNVRDSMGGTIALTPNKDKSCTFTFNMSNNKNMAITAAFTKVDDTATSKSTTVDSVALSNAENAIDSGNLDLTVSDATTDTAAAATVGTGTAVATYDVNLDQYWSQGSTDTRWTNNLTELDEAATVTMQLDDTLQLADGQTYQVVRDHNGTKTVVDSTYDAATNTVSFSSNKYSEFTLVKTAATTTTTTTTTPTTTTLAKTGDTAPWALIAILILGGATLCALGIKRTRSNR